MVNGAVETLLTVTLLAIELASIAVFKLSIPSAEPSRPNWVASVVSSVQVNCRDDPSVVRIVI